jgi:hypothetical protein
VRQKQRGVLAAFAGEPDGHLEKQGGVLDDETPEVGARPRKVRTGPDPFL